MVERDPGAGNERTALAWQRTALALVGGSAVVSRLTIGNLGPAALASVVAGVCLGLWVLLEGRGRYRHSAGTRPRPRPRGGRAALALAVATTVVCLTELVTLLRG